ncbi:Exoribonuclease phosphorolytic domain 1 [Penicillium taxi]|uniref:Exoribonuclease phosphorolytic domain 1 n=1 Tax=Penicillium taxi TaxID=168475 RepID=UPI002544D3FA|nr:Exoribonuclease phosphorolytic domain 1 [Penicillium taxi]KAJ5888670.1 Exoribonuclease phosphorolytic domain 1 [Penicillium taxi]
MRPVTAKYPKKSLYKESLLPSSTPSSKAAPAMSKEVPLSNLENDFILKALSEGHRLDGRAMDEIRPINLSFGDEYGHVKLQLGKTSIVVRISAEVTKPREDRPFDGLFSINMELTAMGSPAWENGKTSDLETYVNHVLDRVVRHSNALDTESLCLVKGVSCWSIRADVHVLGFDGNLIDASCMAIMVGLQHFRRPDAVVRDGKVIVYDVNDRVPVELNITHKPLAVTFHTFHKGKTIIIDANLKEEQAAEGDLIFAVNNAGELCYMSKFSGHPIKPMEIVKNTQVAWDKVKEMNAVLDKVLQADLAKRAKFGMADLSRSNNDR